MAVLKGVFEYSVFLLFQLLSTNSKLLTVIVIETVPALKAAMFSETHGPAIKLFISLFVYLFVLGKGFTLSVFATVYGMQEKLSQCALGSCQESLGIPQSNLCWTKIWWIWSFKNKLPKRRHQNIATHED